MRIVRIVVRHQNKLLKQQARDLKTGAPTTHRAPTTATASTGGSDKRRAPKKASSSKKDTKYYSDSDSDGYYSG